VLLLTLDAKSIAACPVAYLLSIDMCIQNLCMVPCDPEIHDRLPCFTRVRNFGHKERPLHKSLSTASTHMDRYRLNSSCDRCLERDSAHQAYSAHALEPMT
jgi:hypothetical protein